MARYRRQRSNPDVLDNPLRVLGADLRENVEGVGGIVLTAMANDKVLAPIASRFTSGFRNSSNTIGQLIDAGTTLVAARIVGMIGGRVLGAAAGRRMLEGGQMYGAAKAVTAFIPQVSVSALYPDHFPGLALFAPSAPMALPSGTGVPAMAGSTASPASVF